MAAKRSLEFSSAGNVKKSKTAKNSPATRPPAEVQLSPVDISSPEEKATVKGIVTSLSPAKQSQKLFLGELSDGEAIIPLVGFDKTHRQFLHERMDSESPVMLRNCQITTNRTTGKLQVVVKSYTTLEESDDNTLAVHNKNTLGSPFVSISELNTMEQYDRVTLQATAIKVKDPITVSTGKQKQEIIVADATGCTTLTLWEEDIGMIIETKSYQLNRIQVHHYLGKSELIFPRFGASAKEIEDLLEVSPYDGDSDDKNANSATIIGVSNLEKVYNCINCKKSMPCTTDTKIVECQHCQTKQRLKTFRTSAKIFIEDECGQQYTLKAHHEMLSNIIPNSGTITPELLLEAPPFNVTFDNYYTVTSVSRH